jgi:riboflavin synthase
MFTGLVEEQGSVVGIESLGDSVRLTLRGPLVTSDVSQGDSIAVNGCCLTVTDLNGDSFTADVMAESLQRTSLSDLSVGSPVNLERAVAAGARLGGHIVQGHVDGVGSLLERTPSANWDVLRFSLPEELARYVVEKGSITVSGVSLTVVEVSDDTFSVSLIPTTLAETILGTLAPGDRVNLEVDIVAKYVERLLHVPRWEEEVSQRAVPPGGGAE